MTITRWLALRTAFACAAASGCGNPLDAEGQRMAAAADSVTVGLEATMKGAWVVAPAGEADPSAIDTARSIINTVFGQCARAVEPAPPTRGLAVTFSGSCGVPLTDLQFRGGLDVETRPVDGGGVTLHVGFSELQVPSVLLDGSSDFTRLPDDSLAWQLHGLRADVAGQRAALDGGGTVRYSDGRTLVRFDGAGTFALEDLTVAFVADGIERRLIGGCWPTRGTLTVTVTAAGHSRSQTLHFTGNQGVTLDDRGRALDHDLPDRDCHRVLGIDLF